MPKSLIAGLMLSTMLLIGAGNVAVATENLDQQRAELRKVRTEIPGLIKKLELAEQRLLKTKPGLKAESRQAIHSWITAAVALDSVADLFQSHLAVHLLKWGTHNLETLAAVRQGKKDPEGWIETEDDLLSFEDIYNLHSVEPGFMYSGSAPSERGLRWLKKKGFTAIVNLRKDDSERRIVESLGMRYYHLPIPDHLPPTQEQIDQFLEIVEREKAAGGKIYHHCLRGIGRDQTVIACFRVTQGLSAEQAIKEGVDAAPGWVPDQGHAEHGEDASAAEAAKYKDSEKPQFDFIHEFEQRFKTNKK